MNILKFWQNFITTSGTDHVEYFFKMTIFPFLCQSYFLFTKSIVQLYHGILDQHNKQILLCILSRYIFRRIRLTSLYKQGVWPSTKLCFVPCNNKIQVQGNSTYTRCFKWCCTKYLYLRNIRRVSSNYLQIFSMQRVNCRRYLIHQKITRFIELPVICLLWWLATTTFTLKDSQTMCLISFAQFT